MDDTGLQPAAKDEVHSMMERHRKTHNAEDGVPITTVPDCIVNDIMFVSHLVAPRFLHIRQPRIQTAHVDLRQTLVEEDFSGIETEIEPQLFIIAAEMVSEWHKIQNATHMAWFPLRYKRASSKSLYARS